ncbi:hypothetical protein FV242_27635 [Methylobacterium sp. WL64]|uniref:hypothetical protein n=1 Tax=Methylobacterium sp. WL64 TaxID=2603894 RepID=UPI0011CAED8D|nr:hypothetical protein [Methylobacterium sp. WL64]TXM98809.1 hypothetical protein FV242_27635 [Methylobacterium sp. WL64]
MATPPNLPVLICEPWEHAEPQDLLRCVRLSHLDLYELAAVLRGDVEVPTTPPRRLKLLRWEIAWGCYVYAQQQLETMVPEADRQAYDRAERMVWRQREQAKAMQYRWRLGVLPEGLTFVRKGRRDYEIHDADGSILDKFSDDTSVVSVLRKIGIYDRGPNTDRDFDC